MAAGMVGMSQGVTCVGTRSAFELPTMLGQAPREMQTQSPREVGAEARAPAQLVERVGARVHLVVMRPERERS